MIYLKMIGKNNTMKVTVCFGNIRVVVPCDNGEMLVSELIKRAIVRYRKAAGKSRDYWVHVHTLKSSTSGGILDADDQLNDVADDREQIIALFEEQDSSTSRTVLPHNGGDGTSASSGATSPDLFQNGDIGKNDVIITARDLEQGSNLIVRRGSEPTLNSVIKPRTPSSNSFHITQPLERWASSDQHRDSVCSEGDDTLCSLPPRTGGSGRAAPSFGRDPSRQSLAINNLDMVRWLEAQEQQQERLRLEQVTELGRREPLGCSECGEDSSKETRSLPSSPEQSCGSLLVFKNANQPLGIHVVADYDDTGKELGLLIQSIEMGSRVFHDGRLEVNDRIVQVNGVSLVHVNFNRAQQIFREATKTDELRIQVLKRKEIESLAKQEEPPRRESSPSKSAPPLPPRSSTTQLSAKKLTAPTNTRLIGKKIYIQLVKGSDGLGFSVTTRDNQTGDNPIYIKNILPKGAAIQDGRLKSGDRLLEVNNMVISGKSQQEVVTILRNEKLGSTITLTVSRQVETEDEPLEEPCVDAPSGKLRLSFDIPLSDSGSAGLGVSVKGKTATASNGTTQDIGIFIKAIISGGAAALDERLAVNDQVVGVNGESLLGKSNVDAMETLRSAMQKDHRGHINIDVWRLPLSESPAGLREAKISLSEPPNEMRVSLSEQPRERRISQSETLKDESQLESALDETLTPSTDLDNNANYKAQQNWQGGLRNISYQRATHESMNDTLGGLSPRQQKLEYAEYGGQLVHLRPNGAKNRPASTLGFQPVQPRAKSTILPCKSNEDLLQSDTDQSDTLVSVAGENPFERTAMGRQSFSEKRGPNTAKATDFQLRVKEARLRGEYSSATWGGRKSAPQGPDDPESDCGPVLGLRKSTSVEGLHAALYEGEGRVKVKRGRGCNESFRAAVDRSYAGQAMDTREHRRVEEEDGGSEVSGPSRARTTVSAPQIGLQTASQRKTKSREGGILKGLGQVFKIGKHKKSLETPQAKASKQDVKVTSKSASKYEGQLDSEKLRCEDRIRQLREEHQKRHHDRQGIYPQEREQDRWEQRHVPQYIERERIPPRQHYDSQLYDRSMYSRGEPQYLSHYQNYHEIQQARESLYPRSLPPELSYSVPSHKAYPPAHVQYPYSEQKYYRDPSPRGRSQTPVDQLGYLSHYNNKPPAAAMYPPQHPDYYYPPAQGYGSLPRRHDHYIGQGSAVV